MFKHPRPLLGFVGCCWGLLQHFCDFLIEPANDTADYHSNAVEIRLLCNSHNLVADTNDGAFSSDGAVVPMAKGISVMTMRGRTEQSSGEAATHCEVNTWINEQLRHAARSGQKNATIKLTQGRGAAIHSGKYSGEARVTLNWKLEDVK